MVHCFAPNCNHYSESHTCKFFGFPSKEKKNDEYRRWIRLLRRKDREPSRYSRICSCHFRDGNKSYGPEIYSRNQDKIFPADSRGPPKKKKKVEVKEEITLQEIVAAAVKGEQQCHDDQQNAKRVNTTKEIILEVELNEAKEELK